MERFSATTSRSRSSRGSIGEKSVCPRDALSSDPQFLASLESLSFEELSGMLLSELSPEGLIEEMLVDRIIAAYWVLAGNDEHDTPWSEPIMQAEESLCMTLATLNSLRQASAPGTQQWDSAQLDLVDEFDLDWRDRLVLDPDISAESPIIRGTWITVDQIISRIIDGRSWNDLLRSHPELTKDDIRACLAFTIEDEQAR